MNIDKFKQLHQPTGRMIHQDGEDYLFFGGTAYLGLLDHPEYIALYKEGIDRYGLNNGTSRNNNVQLGLYDDVEIRFAERFGFEQAILVSSGYLAAQLVVQTLKGKAEVLYAPNAHPALFVDDREVSSEAFESWAERVVDYINGAKQENFVIVSNTLDNLTPKMYNFTLFSQIKADRKVYFVLDDSHGLGIATANRPFVDTKHLDLPNREVIVVASLAKGMGTDAGVILCSEAMSSTFRASYFYSSASPASPASMYALLKGENIYMKQVLLLQKNVAYLAGKLGDMASFIPRFPVFTVKGENAFSRFLEQRILISSFPYPCEKSEKINRIVVSAQHREEDLDHLCFSLREFSL